MKRGRKAKGYKNITFTMSVEPYLANWLIEEKFGRTYQEAIRNILEKEFRKKIDKDVKEAVEATI